MPGKARERDHDAKLKSGTQTHLTGVSSLKIDGTDYTVPEIEQRIDARIALLDKATQARADLKTAVQAEKLDRPNFGQFEAGFTSIILGMFRNDPKTLSDFDIKQRKTAKTKVATKAKAVDQAIATRKARHTMGKKEKAKIKGTVGPTPPEPAPPSPASPPAAPAPVAAPSATPAPVGGGGAAP